MTSAKPTREQADLAEVLEMVLDKGIVINADIAITVGDTEMLGIELRAAIASFETAAEYGLAFPSGTDMRRVEQASGREPLEGDEEAVDLGIDASSSEESEETGGTTRRMAGRRPEVDVPTVGEGDDSSETGDEPAEADEASAGTDEEETNAETDEEEANGETEANEADAEDSEDS